MGDRMNEDMRDIQGMLDDAEEDDGGIEDVPSWEPACLEMTQKRDDQEMRDVAACGGNACLLCSAADEGSHCAAHIADILRLESTWRNRVKADELYSIIATAFNRKIVRRLDDLGIKQRRITVSEVRLHYEQNHAQDINKVLRDRLMYLNAATRQLERSSLFERSRQDPAVLRPDPKNWDLYLKSVATMERLGTRLQTASAQTTQTVGGRAVPKKAGGRR